MSEDYDYEVKSSKDYIWVGYDHIIRESEKAVCFELGEADPVWIPRSQIDRIDEDANSVHITEWIAEQKELL